MYEKDLPTDVLAMADLQINFGEETMVAHHFVLTSQLKKARTQIFQTPPVKNKLQFDVEPHDRDIVLGTLEYLYRRTFSPQPVSLSGVREAASVALCATRYASQMLLEEADSFLSARPPAFHPAADEGKHPKLMAWEDVDKWDAWDLLAFAGSTDLSKTFRKHRDACLDKFKKPTGYAAYSRYACRPSKERLALFHNDILADFLASL